MLVTTALLTSTLFLFAQQSDVLAGGGPGTSSTALNTALTLTQSVATGPDGRLYFTSQSRAFRLEADGKLTLIAGSRLSGFSGDGGPATQATFRTITGIAVDTDGSVYLSDYGNHRVRRVNTDGTVETVAGNGSPGFSGDDNLATNAEIRHPMGLALDSSGNVFVADYSNHRIRKIGRDGIITTIAGYLAGGFSGDDDSALAAQLYFPSDIAFDKFGALYIADTGNNRIRKIETTGIIKTIAGTGTAGFDADGKDATSTQFNGPSGIAIDASGNIFIADSFNHRIRKIATDNKVSTVAGKSTIGYSGDNGAATSAELYFPKDILVDSSGNLTLSDSYNQRIRRVSTSGTISTIAGNGLFSYGGDDGAAALSQLNQPAAAVYDSSGNLFIADTFNHRLRVVDTGGTIRTIAGNGTSSSSQLSYPGALAADRAGNVYLADSGNNRIQQIAPGGAVTTVAGLTALRNPAGLATDATGNLYIADTGNHTVLRRRTDGTVETLIASNFGLNAPNGLAVDTSGNLYVADLYNQRVLRRDPAGNITVVLTADSGAYPIGVTVDAAGNTYVTLYSNNKIIKVTPDGTQSTLTPGTTLYFPQGLATSPTGDLIISDSGNNRILRLKLTN
jgi:trimeric autotransporter adhesin